jgi:hypothetical protein
MIDKLKQLTVIEKGVPGEDSHSQADNVRKKVTVIVHTDTIVNPRAVTIYVRQFLSADIHTDRAWQHIGCISCSACSSMVVEPCNQHRNARHQIVVVR